MSVASYPMDVSGLEIRVYKEGHCHGFHDQGSNEKLKFHLHRPYGTDFLRLIACLALATSFMLDDDEGIHGMDVF